MANIFDIPESQAAYVLSDQILDIEISLERAEYTIQELTDSYFAKDEKNDKGKACILWEYGRGRVQADITADYLYKIRKTLQGLREWTNAGAIEANVQREQEAMI